MNSNDCTVISIERESTTEVVLTSWLLADLMAGLAGWGEGLL